MARTAPAARTPPAAPTAPAATTAREARPAPAAIAPPAATAPAASVSSGGNTGTGGSPGSGGSTGSGGAASGGHRRRRPAPAARPAAAARPSNTDGGGTDAACQTAELTCAPQIPTVFVLVDQSGSEFSGSPSTFSTLRTAVLNVIIDASVPGPIRRRASSPARRTRRPPSARSGTTVAPALNNYAAINTLYAAAGTAAVQGGDAGVQVLPLVQQVLTSDTGNGAKYILFATDSETDFCDDAARGLSRRRGDLPAAGLVQPHAEHRDARHRSAAQWRQPGAGGAPELRQRGRGTAGRVPAGRSESDPEPTLRSVQQTGDGRGNWTRGPTCTRRPGSRRRPATMASRSPPTATAGGTPRSIARLDVGDRPEDSDQRRHQRRQELHVRPLGRQRQVDQGRHRPSSPRRASRSRANTIAQDATNGWSMSRRRRQLILNGTACTTWQMPEQRRHQLHLPLQHHHLRVTTMKTNRRLRSASAAALLLGAAPPA